MAQVNVAHSRAPQILFLLNEYGPLSVNGLQTILRPHITKRRLQECLLRLYQKGLVIRRFEASPFARQYYELSQADSIRKEINRLTGIPLERLIQPYFRSQELLHNEECAFWAHYLKETFPEADVVRDFKLKEYQDICNKLLLDEDNPEVWPDLVLFFPENFQRESITIAFEIELTRKSNQRLYRKFRKYMNGTRIDGVVYLCHKNTLAETLRSIFIHSQAKGTRYFNHYPHLFLLFGDRSFNKERLEPNLFNINKEEVSFLDWIQALKKIPYFKRRDLKLENTSASTLVI